MRALRFFYGVTLGETTIPKRIPYARDRASFPVVLSADEVVAFTWKDYRRNGVATVMCLTRMRRGDQDEIRLFQIDALYPDEFIRRFLPHTLPDGFHRIRSFGVHANGHRVVAPLETTYSATPTDTLAGTMPS